MAFEDHPGMFGSSDLSGSVFKDGDKGWATEMFQSFEGIGGIRASYNNDAIDSASVAGISKTQGYGVLQRRSDGKAFVGA